MSAQQIERRFDDLRQAMEVRFADLRADIDQRFGFVDRRFDRIDARLDGQNRLILGSWLTLAGLIIGGFFLRH